MGRPQFQKGQITVRGGFWVLRYRDYEDGGKRKDWKLGLVSDNPDIREGETTKIEARFKDEIAKARQSINQGRLDAKGEVTITLGEFIEQSYFPRCEYRMTIPEGTEGRLDRTTVDTYRDIYKVHVQGKPVATVRLREFTPKAGNRWMESISNDLSHKTHLRIKALMSAVFTWAISDEAYVGANPMATVKAYGWTTKRPNLSKLPANERTRKEKIQASNEHAYTLEEVATMLDKLPEPARTVCAVAAFQGLSRSELRGLKWSDISKSSTGEYDGEVIRIQRKVVGSYVGAPKTEARGAEIPLLALTRDILAKYKKSFPAAGEGYIFRGDRLLRPLNLDNLSRKDIPNHINGSWFGWHAFRRGLGSRLSELNVDGKIIQTILRHANISTTQAHYILPSKQHVEAAFRKFENMAREKYGIGV